MANSTPKRAMNARQRQIKAESIRLSDVAANTTTDYADIIVGDGVPSGAYGRASGTTLVYLRKDASSAATAMYLSPDGGSNWTANTGTSDYTTTPVKADSIGGSTLTTGTFALTLADNQADALSIAESTNDYLVFCTTNSAEVVQAKQRLTTTDGVASGTARVVGGRAYSSVAASTAIDGTQEAQTAFDTSYTLPAGTLKAGSIVRFTAWGKHTATTGAETHTLAIKLGSVTLMTTGNVDPATNDYFKVRGEFCVRTAGGSGTVVGWAERVSAASGVASQYEHFYLDSTTLDTTAANLLGVYIDRQGTATDSDSARLDFLHVEVI